MHLIQVLTCLHKNKLFSELSKFLFFQGTIEYLGHVVTPYCIHTYPHNIESMLTWPLRKSQKHLCGFLGFTGYYRCFIRGHATIAAPLTGLLCKDNFMWTSIASHAFESLKQDMV